LRDYVTQLLTENPFLTSAEVAVKLQQDQQITVSSGCVRRSLSRFGFSRKKASPYVNKEGLSGVRKAWCDDSVTLDWSKIISVDESSFYYDMTPAYGYSRRGRRLYTSTGATNLKRVRWSLLTAVSADRVVGWQLRSGGVNGQHYSEFLATLDTTGYTHILHDNARIHHTQAVRDVIEAKGVINLHLPPYSPLYQPIEKVFSALKASYCKKARQPSTSLPDAERRVTLAMAAITPQKLRGIFKSVLKEVYFTSRMGEYGAV
jgi:hypothetical protein